MFTGIIDHCGAILKIEGLGQAKRIWVQSTFENIEIGESIAVDGICLTVMDIDQTAFCCDISPETLRATTAGLWQVKQQVNLEQALLPTSKMGGHMVMGHVDQTCRVKKIDAMHEFIEMTFDSITPANIALLIKKGSVAVNGVSLTINAVSEDGFSVMLIPHTLNNTNLALLREGDFINIEFDMWARIIVQQCHHYFNAIQAVNK